MMVCGSSSLDFRFYLLCGVDLPFFVMIWTVSAPISFDDVDQWRNEFLQQARIKDDFDFPFILVGNKIDSECLVPARRAEDYCSMHGTMTHVRASAKTGQDVDKIFQLIAQAIYERNQEEEPQEFVMPLFLLPFSHVFALFVMFVCCFLVG